MRPKSLLLKSTKGQSYTFDQLKEARFARALYRHDGHSNEKYEWIPTDNKVEGAYASVKDAFSALKIPLSRSTLLGSKIRESGSGHVARDKSIDIYLHLSRWQYADQGIYIVYIPVGRQCIHTRFG